MIEVDDLVKIAPFSASVHLNSKKFKAVGVKGWIKFEIFLMFFVSAGVREKFLEHLFGFL